MTYKYTNARKWTQQDDATLVNIGMTTHVPNVLGDLASVEFSDVGKSFDLDQTRVSQSGKTPRSECSIPPRENLPRSTP